MSACEKCWRDAHAGYPNCDVAAEYSALVDERRANPCTPEEQAGRDRGWCIACGRNTAHQHTGECMHPWCAGGDRKWLGRRRVTP